MIKKGEILHYMAHQILTNKNSPSKIYQEIYQKVLAKEGRLKRYRQRVKQYRQNRLFQNNERKFYQRLGGDDNKTYQQPDAKETERFWTKIWQPKQHNEKAEWIKHITRELEEHKEGPKAEIITDLFKTTLKKVANWKTPGHDGIHGFLFKNFTSIHDRLALEMNKCRQTAHVPEWMTNGRTTLIQKDLNKGTAPNNYRPITCLPMMWKILTAQMREEIYYFLTSRGLFPEEQTGCCKGFRGTAELLYIDQHILNESKTRRKNLAMVWIDYKKTYYMVPHSWITNSLKMYKISDEVINFIDKTIKTWTVELTAGRRRLAEAKIQRGIFHGDALSTLLFLIAMMPLNHILRKCTAGYKLSRSQEKVNHFTYMDDIKLFAKNEKELETLIHTVRICSWDIGMEFGIEKCTIHVMKSGKRQLTDRMELPNKDKIKTLAENEAYKYLGILEADTIKQVEMKEKFRKNISGELENYSRQNSIAEILSNE